MQTRNGINNQWTSADTGDEIIVRNPATDAEVARVPNCGHAETNRAIEAAARAFPAWRSTTAAERAAMLTRFAGIMRRDADRLAAILTQEQGKPLAEANGEILYAASFLEWSAGEAVRVRGEMIPASSPGKRILIMQQPVGVCAAITPWNFPSAMMTRKLGPALAAGCTMVIKPAEQTPLSAIALMELAMEAGFPPGVINVITGDAESIGKAIFANQSVRKVSFTGSTEVGRKLMALAAPQIKRLSLELGGHAPFIVFDDADLDAAVAGAMASKFRNGGQTCVCANRFLVHERVYDAFASKLAHAAASLRIGPGDQPNVQIGPLIDDAAVEKVQRHVDDALSRGASVRIGGRLADVPGFAKRFYMPTVLENVSRNMLVCHEETFGPVAPLLRFSEEREAIELANDSPYGLASYFYTRDASRMLRVAEALDCGVVGANDGMPSTAQAPFGGVKQSGFGREGGRQGIEEYLSTKYVSIGLGS